MVVSRLRRWWGSGRFLPLIAGLTLLTVAAGPGGGPTTDRHGGLAGGYAGPTVSGAGVTRSLDLLPAGAPASDHRAAAVPGINRASSDGGKARFAARSGGTAGLAVSARGRTGIAPSDVPADQLSADSLAGAAFVDGHVVPLTGVAWAPLGSRAPPFLLI